MTLTIRDTTADDIASFVEEPLPSRVRARTMLEDGKIIAIIGIWLLPNGIAVAFAELSDRAKECKVALYKAARRALTDAREAGYTRIVATGRDDATIERWFRHLKFEETDGELNGLKVYRWQN